MMDDGERASNSGVVVDSKGLAVVVVVVVVRTARDGVTQPNRVAARIP